MYRLYRTGNGQVKQVPVNDPVEDQGIEEKFPNPLEAKGENTNEAPFVEEQRRQFDLIKQNESDQARFQTKKLQNSNYQVINFEIKPTDSAVSQAYYYNDYNQATAVGTALDSGVLFGTNTADVTKAKYYNIVYINAKWGADVSTSNDLIRNPSFVDFYLMQKLNTGDFGGKIPRQIEALSNSVNTNGITVTGDEFGVQSTAVDIYNENAYYSQTKDLKGMRTCGLALKRLQLNFSQNITISAIRIDVEVAIDLSTEGNNY
jgi:hypothetical protein